MLAAGEVSSAAWRLPRMTAAAPWRWRIDSRHLIIKQALPSSGTAVYPHMPRASIADRRQSPPVTDSAPSVEGTGVYRHYLSPRFLFVRFWTSGGAKFPKMGDSLPRTPINLRAKFDAASFILAGEIRNRTNTQTNKQKTVNDISTSCRSACVDRNWWKLVALMTGVVRQNLVPAVCQWTATADLNVNRVLHGSNTVELPRKNRGNGNQN